ncbi:MAG: glycerol kinase [Lachnotalea sp.]
MEEKYILGIDQSTQGTKALLFNEEGMLIYRTDLAHTQFIDEKGWVEHSPTEIYKNIIQVVIELLKNSGIDKKKLVGVGISNQRETALVWDKETGEPIYNAIVWQCSRGEAICKKIENKGLGEMIKEHTGLHLSPYFSAAKIAWILQNVAGAQEKANKGELCFGTMDSWLVYQLTRGKEYKTDYSNASRTQLFNITTLKWDEEVCKEFGIEANSLANVTDSNGLYGVTDFDGILEVPIPIHSVLGDSHGALYGQGCLEVGMIKATYGTGSSIMMNIGEKPVLNKDIVTSLAWGMDGKVNYVLEGNINNAGAVITWMEKDLKIITSAKETESLAASANVLDKTYLVPAFTGLGAPYWDSKATGIISGITRTTGQAEIVRAALDCIAYQIADIVKVMSETSGITMSELRVDGGPTKNHYLMQFQSDMLDLEVHVPEAEEFSGIGAAYAAGIALGIYDKEKIFKSINRKKYSPKMEMKIREEKYKGWKEAIGLVLTK